MPGKSYILVIDQGTTGSAALLFDKEGQVVASADCEISQLYPQPGWVEHDPQEIYRKSLSVAREVIQKAGIAVSEVKGLGITNQRETTVVWGRDDLCYGGKYLRHRCRRPVAERWLGVDTECWRERDAGWHC